VLYYILLIFIYTKLSFLFNLLHHTSPSERIMLLGHGSDKGLYFRKNDEEEE